MGIRDGHCGRSIVPVETTSLAGEDPVQPRDGRGGFLDIQDMLILVCYTNGCHAIAQFGNSGELAGN